MAVATNRRSPGRCWRPRLLCCQGFLASPTVIAALLLALSGFSAASKGLPQSAGGAGPSSHGLSKGDSVGDSVGGSGTADRRKRDRLPSSARRAPARQGDHDWKTRRKPATPAAAAERGRRQRPRPQQQHTAATGATRRAEGRPDEEDDDDDDDDDEEDSSLGLGFESDSGELDYFSWSDDDDGDDAWSDDGGDAEESDWGRGAAGGPGGRGKARRHQAAKGGGRAAGGRVGRNMMSMSNIRSRLNVARKRASSVYREAKSLMSSEMEGVVLKATRPDDLPVKPKHLEALMRPTAEMPKEFNVYLPVVRKLWSKMADKEWRVAAKALYIVHRFAADGSIEHASNLKESVAVLRTHHDSRRKVNYFDMDTICDVKAPSWSGEDVAPMAEFLRGYADFVLRRTTQFGPAFAELLDSFAMLAGGGEVMSSVEGLVSAGSKCCLLREEQEGAVTVAAALQVAQDVRDVVEVCAAQLDYLAREWQARSAYPEEVDRWYSFLYENLEPVEALIGRSNELAERHKLPALRPLAAAPLVLKLRDEEVALEKEKQAVLEAEQQQQRQRQQQQCSVDEGEEKNLRPRSHGEQARAVGVKAAGRKEAAARDGGSVGEDQATARRQQGVRGREESAPASTPAGAPGDPAGVATKKKVRSAKGRATGGTKQSSSGSATAAAAVEARSSSSEGGDVTEQPAVRRPGGGTGAGTGTGAAAAPRQEDGARATPSPGASAKRAASGDAAKSRAPKKKKRAPSSTGGKASGREERPTRSSSGAGGVERGAGGGATAAGGSGSSSRREQKRQVRGDSSVPNKERSKRLSPRSEKPPR